MAKLLLVDDEDIVKVMLKSLIPWEIYGITEILDAGNGDEALQLLEREKVDLLITDIRMPVMDGLKLIGRVKEQYAEIPCVVMTAYDEFDYARSALRVGVFDFIVKDEITRQLLEDLMTRIQRQLDKKENDLKAGSIGIAKDDLFKEYIYDNIDFKRFKELVRDFRLKPVLSRAVVLSLRIEDMAEVVQDFQQEKRYLFHKSFLNTCSYLLHNFCNVNIFPMSEQHYAITQSFESTIGYKDINEATFLLISKLKETVKTAFGLSVSIGVSEIGSDLKELYRQAEKSLEYSFIRGRGSVIRFGETLQSVSKSRQVDFVPGEFSELLDNGDIGEVHLYIDRLGERIKRSSVENIQAVYTIFMKHLLLVNNHVAKLGFRLDNIFKVNIDFYEKIRRYHTVDEISIWFKNILSWVFDFIESRENLSHKVKQVMDLIDKTYYDAISLEQMADAVRISPGYLSKLFMKEMGQSFTDYLVQFRMKKAQELLKNSNYQVYEISEMVGYPNLQHFCKMFKKVTGKSANEYRNSG